MKRFWLLTSASALSKMGNTFLLLAIPWAILESTESPAIAILSMGAKSVPYLAGPVLGAVIDRYDKRRAFVLAELVQAAAVGLIPFLMPIGLTYVFGAILLLGVGGVVSSVTSDYSLLPSLVDDNRVAWAYSRYFGLQQIARFLGPAVAGWIVAAFSVDVALWVDAATFAATASAALAIPPTGSSAPTESARKMMRDGVSHFTGDRRVIGLTVALSLYNLGAGSLPAVVVAMAGEVWGWPAGTIGFFQSGGALASAVGAGLAPRLAARATPRLRVGAWLGGTLLGGLVLVIPSPVAMVVGFYLVFGAEGGLNVSTMTLRRQIIPDLLVGRVNTLIRTFVSGAVPLSSLLLAGAAGSSVYSLRVLPVVVGPMLALTAWRGRTSLEDDWGQG